MPASSGLATSRSDTAVPSFGSQFTKRLPREIKPCSYKRTKASVTACERGASIVKYSRFQSIDRPRRRICCVIVEPDAFFHAQTRLINPSRPSARRVSCCTSSWRSTISCVAMPAWSVPGIQSVLHHASGDSAPNCPSAFAQMHARYAMSPRHSAAAVASKDQARRGRRLAAHHPAFPSRRAMRFQWHADQSFYRAAHWNESLEPLYFLSRDGKALKCPEL